MHRFKNIGVVIDLKRSNATSLAYAKDLIETNQAKIHLLCILPSVMTENQIQTIKESIEKKVEFSFILTFITKKAAIEITQYCVDNKIDMILIEPDSEKTKVNRFFHGSLSLSLMRKTHCPVWVIKKPHSEKYQRILIAVDPEDKSTDAKLNDKLIQIGTSLAKRQSAECLLVTV
jgi:nucleotide-binding universal stress UspA family protein